MEIRRVRNLAVLALILAGYVAVQCALWTPACTETDTEGYAVLAWHFARGTSPALVDDDPFRFHSHVWVNIPDGRVMPKYPPGLSVLMALGILCFGHYGIFLVSPLCGLLAIVGAWKLFSLFVDRHWALFGTACLAAHPMLVIYANYPLSHLADCCFAVWGLYFLFLAVQTFSWRHACVAGLACAAAAAVRPVSALLLLPLATGALALLWKSWHAPQVLSRRRAIATVTALCMGYLAVSVLHGLYNLHFFGSPFLTGYSFTDEQQAFTAAQFTARYAPLVQALNGSWMPGLILPGFIGLTLLPGRLPRLSLLGLALATIGVYSAYYWGDVIQWSFLRFFIFLMPVFMLGSLKTLELSMRHAGKPTRYAIMFISLLFLASAYWAQYRMYYGIACGPRIATALAIRQTLATVADPKGVYISSVEPEMGDWFPDARIYTLAVLRPNYIEGAFRRNDLFIPWGQRERQERITAWFRQQKVPAETFRDLLASYLTQPDHAPVYVIIPESELGSLQRQWPLCQWEHCASLIGLRRDHRAAEIQRFPIGIYRLTPKVAKTPAI